MTAEEAIKYGIEQLDVFGGDHAEFIKIAVKALEKQIPKSGYNDEMKLCVCPTCKRLLEGYEKFCWNCGQAIIYWRNEE